MMTWMIKVSLSTTLVIDKAYFKGHQVRRLYVLGFCNQVLLDLHYL